MSLFEQYEEQTGVRSRNAPPGSPSMGPRSVGVSSGTPRTTASSKLATTNAAPVIRETPMFNKERIEFQVPSGKVIYRMAVCDKLIILATKDNQVFRSDLKSSPDRDQLELLDTKTPSANDSVDDIFLDPAGRHILLAMRSGEVLYYSRTSKKPRNIPKLRTHILTAVGWNYQALEGTSGPLPILLGTAQGLIFETEFNAHAADSSSFLAANVDNYWKQVCNLAQPDPVLIKGIFFERLKAAGKTIYAVLIATPTRLYQFRGTLGQTEAPYFQEIFQLDPEKPMTNFMELPGSPRHCCLAAWRPPTPTQSNSLSPTSFAWLNEPGVYYADVALSDSSPDSTFPLNPQLYAFPKDKANRAISLVSTEFHVLIQYPTCVRALSKLACQVVNEDQFGERYGKLMGIWRDPVSGTVWVYSEHAVYRYRVTDESRNVWRIYLEKGDYDAALRFCQNDPATTNMIQVLKAEALLREGKYESSAEIYAQSDTAFEEIALKFSRLRQEKALKLLLLKKADSLRSTTSSPQLFMICSWLMEIYLNSLAQLRGSGKDQGVYKGLVKEFREFLADPKFLEVFMSSPDVFYSILLSHGSDDDYIFLASHLGDTKRLIEFYLERDNHREALRVLASHVGMGAAELIYEYSPQLMRQVPKQVVALWIERGKLLNPHRLLPSLQRYNGSALETEGEAIVEYLGNCIFVLGTSDSSLHNYLVALHCRLKNEKALLEYLTVTDEECARKAIELYDRKGTLRLCVENGLYRAAVHLYRALDLPIQAVELSLTFDVSLAKEIASRNDNFPDDLRKRLWLLIAQHVVTQDSNISKATQLLDESEDLIKIEDILPFFPDFVTIDDFKDAICASLENYNRHIGALKGEVDDATTEAQELRREILDYRSHCLFVNSTEQCFACKLPLLTHQFFVFPCKHHIHWDCLLNLVRPHLTGGKQALVEDLKKQLDTLKEHEDTSSLHSFGSGAGTATVSRREMIKQELEDVVASECPFCGLLMIKSVDMPFIIPEEYERVSASWL